MKAGVPTPRVTTELVALASPKSAIFTLAPGPGPASSTFAGYGNGGGGRGKKKKHT